MHVQAGTVSIDFPLVNTKWIINRTQEIISYPEEMTKPAMISHLDSIQDLIVFQDNTSNVAQ